MKIFLVVLTLISFHSFGQTGLYGKRSMIEIQGIGSMPIAYNFFNSFEPMYKRQGNNLVVGRNLIDYGVRANLMRAFSNQFGMGIEFGLERQSMLAPNSVRLQYNDGFGSGTNFYQIRHEKIRLNTITIMPKLEFSGRSNLLPIGLSHQIGFGYTSVSISDRDYLFIITNQGNDSITSPIENGLINYNYTYTGFTFMYQINMRTPITDQLVLTYGIRYNGNFVRRRNPFSGPYPPGEFDLLNDVRNRRNPSFIQLNFGIGFAF